MKLITFALLLSLCSVVKGQEECVALKDAPNCGCTLPDGKAIDLRNLGDKSGKPAFSAKPDTYTYTYNPCYGYTVAEGCTDVGACQQISGNDRSLGTPKVVEYDNSGDDLVLKYEGGVGGRSFEVTLKCREGGRNDFNYVDERPPLHYRFTLTTRCACPGTCNTGGGGGGGSDPGVVGIVLLSVFFFAIVVYFVAGMIIMRIKFEKTGAEIIPNKGFWFELPLLVKDGVLFTFSPCIKCYQDRRSGYSSMK